MSHDVIGYSSYSQPVSGGKFPIGPIHAMRSLATHHTRSRPVSLGKFPIAHYTCHEIIGYSPYSQPVSLGKFPVSPIHAMRSIATHPTHNLSLLVSSQ